tara:strand:+ start:9346 stop:13455 length:4110 start_codon:yes stop_codon:yes gene_type:complete
MIGLKLTAFSASVVKSIVKAGLSLWYKADRTTAPFSDERIHNPNFSLGSNVDLLDHTQWYRNTTNPTNDPDDDFIFPGNSNTPFTSGQSGITLTEHGFRYKTSSNSTFISMGQSNIMNSAVANEDTLMLTYDILQNSGSGLLYLAMSSNDQALDVTVGKNKVHYFTPTANTFQIKRGGNNLDITIANIKLVKTNPTIAGTHWAVNKLASQDMTCTLTQSSNLITHPSNTNIKVGMTVQGTGIPANTTITEVNVNGSNTQFRTNNFASSNAPATSPLRIRSASTLHVENGAVFIDYNSTDNQNTGISIGNIIKENQRYQVEVVVDSLSTDQKLKIHTGNDSNHLSLGVNTFEMMSTSGNTFSLARSFDSTSVTAKVSKVSLKEIINSVKDHSTYSPYGTLYSGKALEFDGNNTSGSYDAIDLDYWKSESINDDTRNTFALWFNSVNTSNGKIFLGNDNGTNSRFYIGHTNGKLDLGWGASMWTSSVNGELPVIENNTWYRVVIVVEGKTCKIYLNGDFKFSKTNTADYTIDASGIYLASQGPGNTSTKFDGKLADFQIYDKAWTASDVNYDYYNPDKDVFDNHNTNILTTDCKALYRLNEGSGDRVYNAAPVLGANLLAGNNSTFDGANNWSVYSTGSISTLDTGVLQATLSGGGNNVESGARLDTNGLYGVAVGKIYEVKADVWLGTSTTTAGWRIFLGGDQEPIILNNTPTTYTFILKPTTTAHLTIYNYDVDSDDGTFFIDNASVKEITLSNSLIHIGDPTWVKNQPYIPQLAMSSYSKKGFFTGVNEKIDLGSLKTIANGDAASISFWYFTPSHNATDHNYILGGGSINPSNNTLELGRDYLRVDEQNKLINWRIADNAVIFDFPDLEENKLCHICVTRAAGGNPSSKCYVNGVETNHLTDVSDQAGGVYSYRYIGSYGSTTSSTCFIDELSIFNKQLSQTEVQEIFNSGLALDVRDHSYYTEEVLQKGDWVSQGAIGDSTTPWFKNNQASAQFSCVIGDFKGRTNVMKYECTDANSLNKKLTQEINITAGEKYICEVDVWVESGNFRCDSPNSQIADNFFQLQSATDGWVTLTSNVLTALTTSSSAEFWIRPSTSTVACEFYIDKVSLKRYDAVGYWRNNGAETWTDLSPYGNDGTSNTSVNVFLQEVPYFKKDTFGLPMNRVRQKGLNLDGDGYIKTDTRSGLNMSNGFSTSFWVNCRDVNTRQWLVTKGTAVNTYASDKGFGTTIFTPSNPGEYPRIYATINTSAAKYQLNTTEALVENDWLYVTVTYTPNTNNGFKLYINEDLISSITPSGTVNETHDLIIGENYLKESGNVYPSVSIIDEVKWYNKSLSLSEIKKNYKATKSQHKNNRSSNWSDDFSDSFI